MLKHQAINLFGSPADLARALGISVAAIYQWGETIPRLRVFQIREIKPECFNADGSLKTEAAKAEATA